MFGQEGGSLSGQKRALLSEAQFNLNQRADGLKSSRGGLTEIKIGLEPLTRLLAESGSRCGMVHYRSPFGRRSITERSETFHTL
jgi:hypothetical protein